MNKGRIARVASIGEKVIRHPRGLAAISKLGPPSRGMGVKAWAKHLRRLGGPTVRIKDPARYLNAHARRAP